jgi:hypothetical protein
VKYANAQAQSDVPQTTPTMQSAFAHVLSLFNPTVTSVMHGGHVKDSAHYAGRAIDVGAFGGTAVGFNLPTWQAIMSAIASGKFERIGTIAAIVNNPQAQAYARSRGVLLFEDEGSGNHVHFQVAM